MMFRGEAALSLAGGSSAKAGCTFVARKRTKRIARDEDRPLAVVMLFPN